MKFLKEELYNRMILGRQDRHLEQVSVHVDIQVNCRVNREVYLQVYLQVLQHLEGEMN